MSTALSAPPPVSPADGFLSRYEGLTQRLPGPQEPRRAAAEVLRRDGLPNSRDEGWRYTSLVPLAEARFHEPLTEASGFVADTALPDLEGLADIPRLVFVQGRFSAAESVLPEGAIVRSFAASADFGVLPQPERDRLVALNTMLAEDGAIIEVPENTDAGTLLLVSAGRDIHGTPVAFHPRHAIRLAAGATLTVIEVCVGHGQYLHNPVTEIRLSPNARLTMCVCRTRRRARSIWRRSMPTSPPARPMKGSPCRSADGWLAPTCMHASPAPTGMSRSTRRSCCARPAQRFHDRRRHDAPNCASRQTVKHVLAAAPAACSRARSRWRRRRRRPTATR